MTARAILLTLAMIAAVVPAGAHPAPFSYVDLVVRPDGIEGTLVVHVLDLAHDLGIDAPERLLEPAEIARRREAILALLAPRIGLLVDGDEARVEWTTIAPAPERDALRLGFRLALPAPGPKP